MSTHPWITGDIGDTQIVEETVKYNNIRSIIHLAALQIPFCVNDPVGGAKTNVLGTVNVFEAARKCGLKRLAYTSSIAAHGFLSKNKYKDFVKYLSIEKEWCKFQSQKILFINIINKIFSNYYVRYNCYFAMLNNSFDKSMAYYSNTKITCYKFW